MLQYEYSNGKIKVLLKTKNDTKNIGNIINGILYKYVPKNNIQRCMQALGFNKELLESKTFSIIRVNYGGDWLETTAKEVLNNHEFRKYKNFEEQAFLPLRKFNGYNNLKEKNNG